MIVRDSQNGFTPASRNGRRFTPTSRTRKGQVPLVHPSVADTLVEGVRVVFDDWTDDFSLDRAMVKKVPPKSARPAARWEPTIVDVESMVEPPSIAPLTSLDASLRPAPMREQRPVPAPEVAADPRRWGRGATVLAAVAVAGVLVLSLGALGALVVAVAAGAVFLMAPSGIDVVMVPPASGTEIHAPAPSAAGEGRSEAELVVMPDPGFHGGTTLEPIRGKHFPK